jgi:hypothetical protein
MKIFGKINKKSRRPFVIAEPLYKIYYEEGRLKKRDFKNLEIN